MWKIYLEDRCLIKTKIVLWVSVMQQPTYPSGRDHNDQSNILTLVINSLLIDKYVVVM